MIAARHDIDEAAARKDMVRRSLQHSQTDMPQKVIDKDVPRTDRNVPYYRSVAAGMARADADSGDGNVHLTWMRHILITYAVFHAQACGCC